MSMSGQEYIAKTQGTEFTLYKMAQKLGIPLTKEQIEFQQQLEKKYPPVVGSYTNS